MQKRMEGSMETRYVDGCRRDSEPWPSPKVSMKLNLPRHRQGCNGQNVGCRLPASKVVRFARFLEEWTHLAGNEGFQDSGLRGMCLGVSLGLGQTSTMCTYPEQSIPEPYHQRSQNLAAGFAELLNLRGMQAGALWGGFHRAGS